VDNLVVLCLNLGDIDTPAFGGGGLEHPSRRRAAFAHRLDEMAQAARAIGVLVAVSFLVTRRLRDAHARPVSLEFVGNRHRQAGARTGAHFGAVRDNRHEAAGIDRDENMRIAYHPARHLGCAGGVGERSAGGEKFGGDDEAARGDHSLQETTAADILDVGVSSVHVTLLWRPP